MAKPIVRTRPEAARLAVARDEIRRLRVEVDALRAFRPGEQLLSVEQTAARLGLSRRQFYTARAALVARGLQEIAAGAKKKYRAASVDALIVRCAERGEAIYKIEPPTT